MKNSINKSAFDILREKAEELLKKNPLKTGSQFSETDTMKLIHELKVHLIELELQNEDLMLSRSNEQEATEKNAELYDFAPSGFFTLSKEGEIFDLNINGAKIFNKDRSHLINSRFGLFISRDTQPIFNLFLTEVFNRKVKEECEVTLSQNGNLPMYVHLTGIVKKNGEQCYVTVVDITGRKLLEEGLIKSKDRYKKAQDVGHFGSWEYDISNEALWISDEGKRVYGLNSETDIFTVEEVMKCVVDRNSVNQALINLIEKKEPYNIVYDIIPLNSSEKKTISGIAKLVSDENDNPVKVSGVILDITERKQVDNILRDSVENLQKINAEKDKFFSIMAHDLRSPFQSLLNFSQMVAEELPTLTLEKIQKIALNMSNSAEKLFNLLENLLEWSIMQRGTKSFKPESFILSKEIVPIIDLVRDAADKKMIRISYAIPDDLRVTADAQMFESLMRNFVFNAVKYTPRGGEVTITAKPIPDNSVEILIKDTGIGMNKNMIDNLFRLDGQINRKGTEGEPSTGLGLIICKEFIEKHDGKLWVESEEGKGSSFYFTLPNNHS